MNAHSRASKQNPPQHGTANSPSKMKLRAANAFAAVTREYRAKDFPAFY
jgi:hypothetical protein